jgi:PAS domain S-box-containing protein
MRPLRVLHLEDSPLDAELVRHKLKVENLSCDILVVSDKKSFEAALAAEPFALILLDNSLPGYDGVTALKHAQLTRPDVPVILISGAVGDGDAVKCLHLGATDYLLKDRLERLVPAIQRAIQEAEIRRTRKRAESALAESEDRKAAILDSVLDCIISIRGDGTVIEFNAAAERTFGYTKAEAIGRPIDELVILPRFRDAHRARLARYVATGHGPWLGQVVEIVAMRSDGSEIPVEMATTAVRIESATIFSSVLRDITARRRADETRARLAAIVESSDDAIISVSMDDTILTWNAGAERLYGYAASEVIGRNRSILAPESRIGEFTESVARAARGEACESLETQRRRKDGSLIDVSLMTSAMTDPSGRITSMSAIARDITRRKKDEAELKQLNHEIQLQRLRDAEEARKRAEDLENQILERRQAEAAVRGERDRAQRFLDTADVTLLALDVYARITLINRSGCDLLGWTEHELLGRDFIETCVPPEARDEARNKFANILVGPDSSVVDIAVLTRSGNERMVEWRNTLLRNVDGHVVSTLSCGTDLTLRRGLEEERLRTADLERRGIEAQQASRFKSEFLANMSHELRTPLNAIIGFTAMMHKGMVGPVSEVQQTYLGDVLTSSRHLLRLINDVLDLAKVESGKIVLRPEPIDLVDVVDEVRDVLSGLAGTRQLRIETAIDPAVAAAVLDPARVKQILYNYLSNAIKFTPDGGRVEVRIGPEGPGSFRIDVTDTGPGIAAADLKRLFVEFQQLDNSASKKHQGTGLGLALTKRLVEAHGGYVAVRSAVGLGTTFSAILPRVMAVRESDDAKPALVEALPPTRVEASIVAAGPPEPILIVDDNPQNLELARALLSARGYDVRTVADAEAALNLLTSFTPRLILVDIQLPGMDGLELTRRLKADPARRGIVIIAVTAYAMKGDDQKAFAAGCDGYVSKPIDIDALPRIVAQHLARAAGGGAVLTTSISGPLMSVVS